MMGNRLNFLSHKKKRTTQRACTLGQLKMGSTQKMVFMLINQTTIKESITMESDKGMESI